MKLLVLFSIFLFVQKVYAIEINDPSDLLGTIDSYLNVGDFDSAYKQGDKAWYSNQECTYIKNEDGVYSVGCMPIETSLLEVSSKDSSKVIINNLTVTKDFFNQFRGNMLRKYFSEAFNNSELSSVAVDMEKIQFENALINGNNVQAIRAYYSINICRQKIEEQEVCFFLPQEMLLGRSLPAVAQMLEHIYIRIAPVNIPVSKLINFQR